MTSPSARHRLLLPGLLAAGCLLRALHFLHRPSLAMDEARLAVNIAGRGFAELAGHLDLDQSAPLLFLWGERAATRLFGVNELALRSLPLLAGIGVVALSYGVLRRYVSSRAALLGVAILAVAPTMVAYSNEVKQYVVEALVALVLVHLALTWLNAPNRRVGVLLAVVGVAAVWVSGSAVLVLAGVAPVILFSPRQGQVGLRTALVVCLTWAISFGLAYAVVYRAAVSNTYMARYWAPELLTPGAGFVGRSWYALKDVVWGFVAGHAGVPRRGGADGYVTACAMAGLVCVLVGAWDLSRTRGAWATFLLIGPILATLVASACGLYPVGQRLVLFAVPIIVILGVAGLDATLPSSTEMWRRRAWLAVSGMVVLPLMVVSVLQSREAGSRMRGLVQEIEARRRGSEPIYVFGRALPVWEFYTTDWSAPDMTRLTFLNRVGGSGGPAFENAPSRGRHVLPDEGDGLVYRSSAGLEVIGIPTGMEYVSGHGLVQDRPDPGWVEREADRIQRAAAPAIWIVMVEFLGPEYELVEELKRRGGTITHGRFGPGHVVARYEFE